MDDERTEIDGLSRLSQVGMPRVPETDLMASEVLLYVVVLSVPPSSSRLPAGSSYATIASFRESPRVPRASIAAALV